MKNIKTFEGFLDYFKSKKKEEVINDDNDLEREELIKKTERSISIAQINGSPTYYNHLTKTTEVTPAISSKKQSLRNIRKELK